MKEKCEICGATDNLWMIVFRPEPGDTIAITACNKCRIKHMEAIRAVQNRLQHKTFSKQEDGLEFGTRAPHPNYDGPIWAEKKEAPAMQVTYKGVTGELVKLEQHRIGVANEIVLYDLTLYDSEKQATVSFSSVKPQDVKFLGGAVTFGG